MQITKSVNWALTAPEQGHFQFWVYVYGTSEPTSASIILTNDKAYKNNFTANYGGDFKFNLRPGWNLITLDPTDWITGAGAPSWQKPIKGIRITIKGGGANSYSFDQMISGAGLVP